MENNMNINNRVNHVDEVMLVDELSTTEFYIGLSDNSSDKAKATWKIKRVLKVGSIWTFQYPDGIQKYEWAWDARLGYDYK
jgi:hypothetical protein